MVIKLSRAFASIHQVPVVDRVHSEIFSLRYFQPCLSCSFCHDQCCSYGVDVELPVYEKILELGPKLGLGTKETLEGMFTGEWTKDPEFPGGRMTRTRTQGGRCVFLNRTGRGCSLHSSALAHGLDYHQLKPMVSSLFPLTFNEGLLHASDEMIEKSLICAGEGESLYQGGRGELLYFFGEDLVYELDTLSRQQAEGCEKNSIVV